MVTGQTSERWTRSLDVEPMKPVRRSHSRRWADQFNKLAEFRADNGHCNVASSCTWDPELGKWICNQRERHRKGLLSTKRVQRLKELGFQFDRHNDRWESQYCELIEFKKEHGYCNVPDSWPENLRLARWVMTQRQRYRKGKLSMTGFRGWRPSVSSGAVRNKLGMKCTGGWSGTRRSTGIVMSHQDGRRSLSWETGWLSRGIGGSKGC